MSEDRPAAEIVGVVGAGTMGAGIAQVALEGGARVRIFDADPAAIGRARGRIADGLERSARSRGADDRAAAAETALALARLEPAPDLATLASGAMLVIEAAIEDLATKQAIFAALDAAAPPTAILATNTSALPVGAIGARTDRPDRVVGLHFFNPAPVMALVEVIAPRKADPVVVAAAEDFVRAWGKTPIRAADSPGFIVNRVNRPFTLGALRLVEAGRASVAGIDAALRADGFPMGPFELIDLIGVDVNLAATRGIYEAFGLEPRFRPSPIQERLVAAGRLGRKTGAGFYRYDRTGRPGRPVRPAEPSLDDPGPGPPAAHAAASERPRATGSPLGPVAIVERIVLAIVNEAALALGERVAGSAGDIDRALRLGAGHPLGPFERLARLGGPAVVVGHLERLRAEDDPDGDAFAPAPLLVEAAARA